MKNAKIFALLFTTALLLLATVFSLTTAGCGGGGGGSAPGDDIINTPLLGTITGRVIDQSGNGVSGATIKITTKVAEERANYGATSASDGTFKIQNVPAGEGWPMAISKSGFTTLQLTVDSVAGQTTEIPEDETTLVSSGPTPTPSPEPTVSPSPEPTVTPTPSPEPSPSPSVTPTPSPEPTPSASPSPSPSSSPTPTGATVNITVTEWPAGTVPVEGVTLQFRQGGIPVAGIATKNTDNEGKATFTNVVPGNYNIWATKTGYILYDHSVMIITGSNNVSMKIEKE